MCLENLENCDKICNNFSQIQPVSADAEIFKFLNFIIIYQLKCCCFRQSCCASSLHFSSTFIIHTRNQFFVAASNTAFTFPSLLPIIQQCACIVVNFTFNFLNQFFVAAAFNLYSAIYLPYVQFASQSNGLPST